LAHFDTGKRRFVAFGYPCASRPRKLAPSTEREPTVTHQFTTAILIHIAAALVALALGAAVFLRPKGTFAHRVIGRAWVALMLVTAISTWWIRGNGSFSWIHGLSVFVLAMLTLGVYYAIHGRIRAHRQTMQGLYFGALIISGAFALLPQRLLGQRVWSALGVI
jgi:uncharacterized membrane protein